MAVSHIQGSLLDLMKESAPKTVEKPVPVPVNTEGMSRLEALITDLCPVGVKYIKIDDVILSLKTGLNPRQSFVLNESGANCNYITGKDIYCNKINISSRTDKIHKSIVNLINKRACLSNGDLLFASTGTGTVGRMAFIDNYDETWAISETLYSIKVDIDRIYPKYLMYYLQSSSSRSQYEPKISKGSVPHLKIKDLTDVIVPVPPLPVQEEIVRILDTFTELTTELTTELMKRKEQYLYYRNKLLCFDDVKFLKLKETCTNEGWKSYSK